MRTKSINFVVVSAVVFLFSFVVSASAQTNVYVGDEEVIVNPEGEEYEEEIDMRMETENENSASEEKQDPEPIEQSETTTIQENTSAPTQSIETAPEEAPDAGPAESVIIIAAITFGFLGAVIFLALMVHSRY